LQGQNLGSGGQMRLCQHATGSLYFQLQLQLIVNVQIFAKKKMFQVVQAPEFPWFAMWLDVISHSK